MCGLVPGLYPVGFWLEILSGFNHDAEDIDPPPPLQDHVSEPGVLLVSKQFIRVVFIVASLHDSEDACRLRHVFVDERRSAGRAPGPSDAAAAMIMSNSVQQWDRSYDMNIRKREAQAGADAMLVWRQHMLEQSRGEGVQGGGSSLDLPAGAGAGAGREPQSEEAGPSRSVDWEEQSWEGETEEDEDDVVIELSDSE